MSSPNFPTEAREILLAYAHINLGELGEDAFGGYMNVDTALAALTSLHYQELEAVLEGLKKQPIRGKVPLEAIGTIKAGYYRDGFNEADLIWAKNIDQALAEVRREMEAK